MKSADFPSFQLAHAAFRATHRHYKLCVVLAVVVVSTHASLLGAPVTEVIVKTGDKAPDGDGTFSTVNAFTPPVINNHGSVGFRAALANTTIGRGYGNFLGDYVRLVQVARTSDQAFGSKFYTFQATGPGPALDDNRQLLFVAGTGPNSQDRDLIRSEPASGIFSRLFMAHQPAPDGGNAVIANVNQAPPLNQSGAMAVVASIPNATISSAIYRTAAPGSLTEIVRLNQSVPGGNGQFGTFSAATSNNLVLNESGQVAFEATLFNTSGGPADNSGLYRGDGTTLTEIARAGQSLPGGGTLVWFATNTSPDLNDSGEVVFPVSLDGATGQEGIFKGSGGALTEIARQGETIPNSTDLFRFFNGYARINNAGQVAFIASITPVPSTGHTPTAIFRADGNPLHRIIVAKEGQTTPNGVGIFSSLFYGPFCLNNAGQIAFFAGLDIDLSNITPVEEHGIFFFDGTTLHQVARDHDPLLGSTISALRLAGTAQSNSGGVAQAERSGLNDAGQIAFGFTLEDGREGIAIWSPVAPPQLSNISTRVNVQTGNNVAIAGFIIFGSESKSILIRAIGPALAQFGVADPLQDPTIELHAANGDLLASNDNWKDTQQSAISATGKAPPNDKESAILMSLPPGAYTVVMRGVNNGTGDALVEVNDLDPTSDSRLNNISTRGFVQNGAKVLIAGTIVHGPGAENILFRALGPTLADPPFNVPNALANPFLDLRDANGLRVASNANWKDAQQAEIQATRFAPHQDAESAILITLQPGNYTAIVSGENGSTGNALVDVYALP
jgi:hypothetical protein